MRDADVVKVLLMLAEVGGMNLVISGETKGLVTLQLDAVPVQEAMEIVLGMAGLARVQKGSVIGILPRRALLEDQRQEAEARTLGQAVFRTEIVRLQFARSTELARTLAPLLTRWGRIIPDSRTNSLIIRDVPESSIFLLIEQKQSR